MFVVGAATLLSCLAFAVPSAGAASSTGTGWLRFGHFVGGAPVDVKVDGKTIGTDLAFRSVTGYALVSAGVHTLTVVSSAAPSGAALAKGHVTVPANGAVTVAAVPSTAAKATAHGSVAGGITLQVFSDDLSSPAPGHAKVRVIHTIPGAPVVTTQLTSAITSTNNGPKLDLAPVGYGQASPYMQVPAGTYQVVVKAPNGATVAVGRNWPIRAGTVTSVFIVEAATGPTLEVLSDAASSTDPNGAMETGFGGTAPRATAASAAMLPVGLSLVFFVGLAGVLRLRRRAIRTAS